LRRTPAVGLIEALINWFSMGFLAELSDRYPILVGIPLLLSPIFILAAIIYLIKT
jgi:hypothetical protein